VEIQRVNAIVTHGLTKTYTSHIGRSGMRALDGLDLTVAENEVFGFLGRNGAGKTTTIKILCSLLHPTGGRAEIMGRDIRLREARRAIGFLPENPYFYEYLTPRETLHFYGRLSGLDTSACGREWDKLSKLLDLTEIGDQRIRGFSKGMRQRVGCAVALVGDPPVLILDEPMSGLDPLGRRMVREVILRMRDEGKTVFFSSHLLSDVEQICDRVGVLVQGKLTVSGRLNELLTRRIDRIEIIATGLTEGAAAAEFAEAFERHSEDGDHFSVTEIGAANRLVERILAKGGRLFLFNPMRESLEEYFMRQQEESR